MSGPGQDKTPTTELGPNLWCDKHLGPLEPEWPKGYGMAMISMFHHAVQTDKIQRGSKGQTELIEVALNVNAPVCCNILGDDLSRKIIRASLQGEAYGVPKPQGRKPPGTKGPDEVE